MRVYEASEDVMGSFGIGETDDKRGAETHRVYSVVLNGYNTTELLHSSDLKPLPTYRHAAGGAGAEGDGAGDGAGEQEESNATRRSVEVQSHDAPSDYE